MLRTDRPKYEYIFVQTMSSLKNTDNDIVPNYMQGGPKSKLLTNYQNIVFNRIKACQSD